jgi:hypothetical protein
MNNEIFNIICLIKVEMILSKLGELIRTIEYKNWFCNLQTEDAPKRFCCRISYD